MLAAAHHHGHHGGLPDPHDQPPIACDRDWDLVARVRSWCREQRPPPDALSAFIFICFMHLSLVANIGPSGARGMPLLP